MDGSAACCGEVVSATSVGGSGVASRDFSKVVAAPPLARTSRVTKVLLRNKEVPVGLSGLGIIKKGG